MLLPIQYTIATNKQFEELKKRIYRKQLQTI